MVKVVFLTFIGYLLGIGVMSKKHSEHIDVMQKLTYNMVEDAYYTGCRAAGGQPTFCQESTEEYIKPIDFSEE